MPYHTFRPDNEHLQRGHHWYEMFDNCGNPAGFVAAHNKNEAEDFAKDYLGFGAMAVYTEV